MKLLKIITISVFVLFLSCNTTEKKKTEQSKTKEQPLLEQTSAYFSEGQNVIIYYTESIDLGAISTELFKKMREIEKDKKMDFNTEKKSRLICFNDKSNIPDVTNNPDEAMLGKYGTNVVCMLQGTKWGNHKLLFGGVKSYYKGNYSGFNKK